MTEPTRSGSELVRRLVVPLAAMTIAFGAGWSVGSGRQATTDWQVATVSLDGGTARATVGKSTLEIGSSVPVWIGANGATHTASHPDCLDSTDAGPGSHKVVVGTVTTDGKKVDAVVAFDCRAGS